MEHLPIPTEAAFSVPKIPWLGMHYDDLGFHGYPERKGWTIVDHNGMFYLLRSDDLEEDEDFDRAFHQSWLWTGLLVEVMKVYGIVTNFSLFTTPRLDSTVVYPEGTVFYLTTEHLPKYLDEMAARHRALPLSERRRSFGRVMSILGMARDFAACAADADGLRHSSLTAETALSVLALGQTLQNAVRIMVADMINENSERISSQNRSALMGFRALNSAFLRRRLKETGWCESEVELLEANLGVDKIYYASMLQRKGPPKDHSGCSGTTCIAHQIVEGLYETRHTRADCQCDHVIVDIEGVGSILRNDGFAAVDISNTSAAPLPVVDVAANPMPYVAISHVWSDGLGNERANSLPKCQLQRLQQVTLKRHKTKHSGEDPPRLLIWIDTLCVPHDSNRRLALEAIGRTYRRAESVLVLDAELTNVGMNEPWQELCLRAAMCGWSRRLWTFQEAALAGDRLCFQFKEGAVDLWERAMASLPEDPREVNRPFTSKSDEDVVRLFSRRAKPQLNDESPIINLIWMTASLLFRRTSKQKDEPFCLASAIGLETATILRFEMAEERMRELWRMLPDIPSTVFFLRGDKLRFPGFRWAAKTLLDPNSNLSARYQGEEITRTARWHQSGRGVVVQLPGTFITFKKPLLPEEDLSGHSIWVKHPAGLAESFLIELRSREMWGRICNSEQIVLIVENDTTLPLGFLASPQDEEGGLPHAEYICPVVITPVKEMINWKGIGYDTHGWHGECTPEQADRDWCIS